MTFDDLLESHGVATAPPGHRHTNQNWYNFDCPYCGPNSSKFHMGYHKEFGFVNCWRCGRHGVVETLALLLHKTKHEASLLWHTVPRTATQAPIHQTKKLRLPGLLGPLKQRHTNYLQRRGFDAKTVTRLWGLQGLTVAAKGLSWRVFIPNFRHGQLVSWVARSTFTMASRRYISAPADQEAFPAKHWLYGLDYCRHAIVICEGPTDVWRIGPGAVATMGAAVTAEQIELMSKYLVRVVCFDNDKAGQQRAHELCSTLNPYQGMTYKVVLDAPDPGSAGTQEIKQLRKRFLE